MEDFNRIIEDRKEDIRKDTYIKMIYLKNSILDIDYKMNEVNDEILRIGEMIEEEPIKKRKKTLVFSRRLMVKRCRELIDKQNDLLDRYIKIEKVYKKIIKEVEH